MTGSLTPADYVKRNEVSWTDQAPRYVDAGRRRWAEEPSWGIWNIPEADVHLLPDVDGRDTVELGCGTGYVSAWLARLGARPVGVDLTAAQLATARTLQAEFGLGFPLVRAAAEWVPLRAESFDLVISEYGAAIWSDPYRWIPEAARLLRAGGSLVFLGNSYLLSLCVHDDSDEAATDRLLRPAFGMHRFEWLDDDDSVEFHLPHGEWIRLLRANGFRIDDLVELQAPAGATTPYPFVTGEWAARWPAEEVWIATKTA